MGLTEARDKNQDATKVLLSRLIILDLTDASSLEAGRILALLEEKGNLIGFRDALIAAIAITHKVPLTTRDIEHFQGSGPGATGITLVECQ